MGAVDSPTDEVPCEWLRTPLSQSGAEWGRVRAEDRLVQRTGAMHSKDRMQPGRYSAAVKGRGAFVRSHPKATASSYIATGGAAGHCFLLSGDSRRERGLVLRRLELRRVHLQLLCVQLVRLEHSVDGGERANGVLGQCCVRWVGLRAHRIQCGIACSPTHTHTHTHTQRQRDRERER